MASDGSKQNRSNAVKQRPSLFTMLRQMGQEVPGVHAVDERGQYKADKLGRNEECPCIGRKLLGADQLAPHKVKRHDALYAPIRAAIIGEQRRLVEEKRTAAAAKTAELQAAQVQAVAAPDPAVPA